MKVTVTGAEHLEKLRIIDAQLRAYNADNARRIRGWVEPHTTFNANVELTNLQVYAFRYIADLAKVNSIRNAMEETERNLRQHPDLTLTLDDAQLAKWGYLPRSILKLDASFYDDRFSRRKERLTDAERAHRAACRAILDFVPGFDSASDDPDAVAVVDRQWSALREIVLATPPLD